MITMLSSRIEAFWVSGIGVSIGGLKVVPYHQVADVYALPEVTDAWLR